MTEFNAVSQYKRLIEEAKKTADKNGVKIFGAQRFGTILPSYTFTKNPGESILLLIKDCNQERRNKLIAGQKPFKGPKPHVVYAFICEINPDTITYITFGADDTPTVIIMDSDSLIDAIEEL